jgi:DNA-binding transcriptional ArsR family regulator
VKLKLTAIPEELKYRPQWVTWKSVERDGKLTKIPLDPETGGPGKSNDPATWGTFDKAVSHYQAHQGNGIAGIGFVFSPDDPFTGVDLDHALVDGSPRLCARLLLRHLGTYSEVSPSGKGAHVILKGKLPAGGNRKQFSCGLGIELYDRGRFFTVTGHHLPGTPTAVENRQAELEALHRKIFFGAQVDPRSEGPRPGPSPTLDLSDRELIEKASAARNGEKFSRLWAGDWEGAGYPSQSEGDLGLAMSLAFWTGGDPERIDRLFRQSGLYREKWDRPDYREKTIGKALAQTTEFYTPGKGTASGAGQNRDGDQTAHEREKAPGGNGNGQGAQEAPRPGPQTSTIRFVTGAELQAIEFKEPAWVVPGILPEGLCLFSARPKKGKTWWSLNISVAKATGGCALNKQDLRLEQGKVLYLALEDKLRRAQKRLKTIMGDAPFPEDLILAETWPRLDKGGLEALRDFLKDHDDCKMVVVDSFAKIKPVRPKNSDPYEFDMAWGGLLQSLAQERQVCILLIYHNRKSEGEDPLDDVIGSTGLTGAVDAVLILRRGRGQADGTLLVTGRDVEEQELALKFHPGEGLWELIGPAAECAISQERKEILLILSEAGPKTLAQLAKILNKKYDAVRMILARMKDAGLVRMKESGEYQIV